MTPRIVRNSDRDAGGIPAPPTSVVARFHAERDGYAPSPLRPLVALADEARVRSVMLKDESDRFGLPAFKILGASWAVEQALVREPATTTLVAASAGNHGRAVARAAADRGLACRIYLPAVASASRAEAIGWESATVIRVDGRYEDAVRAAERDADSADVTLVADVAYTADAPIAAAVIDGYATLFAEIAWQHPGCVQVLVVPVGVGSLAAAAVRAAVHDLADAFVIGVEPVAAACLGAALVAGEPVVVETLGTSMAGLDCATVSHVAWPTLRDGIGATIAVSDAETQTAMRDLARWGLRIGDCGAATVAALRVLASDSALREAAGVTSDAAVVLVATEGVTDPSSYARTVGDGA